MSVNFMSKYRKQRQGVFNTSLLNATHDSKHCIILNVFSSQTKCTHVHKELTTHYDIILHLCHSTRMLSFITIVSYTINDMNLRSIFVHRA